MKTLILKKDPKSIPIHQFCCAAGGCKQGCQMVYFQTKKFRYTFEGVGMEYFGIFYDHLVYLMAFLCI
jgi:hypothetical protein